MVNNVLKGKLREGRLTIGSWITLGHVSIAEIMAMAEYDWLVIDLEHSTVLQKRRTKHCTKDGCRNGPAVSFINRNTRHAGTRSRD